MDAVGEVRMLIDGQLCEAATGSRYDNINPATEAVIGQVADAGLVDMDRAIGAARTAFDEGTWSRDVALRVRCLRQLQEGLQKHAEELRAAIVAEVGTPIMLTYGPQLDTPVAGIAWVADLLENYAFIEDLGTAEPFGIKTHRFTQREPAGVVGAITPWNFPMQINLAKVVPALAAGCTVVLKPAPDTPYCATLLGRIIAEETEIPAGVVNIVTSAQHEVGALLSEDPRVDMVSFTGSTATGRKVMIAGAQTIKKVFLELGGKSALIALDDADLSEVAGQSAFQITTHAGQGCAILTRLLLPRERYDEGVALLVGMLEGWPVGDPTDAGVLTGPLVRREQQEKVLDYIRIGVAEGATVAIGGGVPESQAKGYFVEPTVLTGVESSHRVAQEEIFGPVLVVIPHDGDDDAVRIANDSVYGLSGGVISASVDRARAVADRIRTGTVMVNGGIYYGADVPFGGYGQSGVGREMGKAGFEEYLEIKSVAVGI